MCGSQDSASIAAEGLWMQPSFDAEIRLLMPERPFRSPKRGDCVEGSLSSKARTPEIISEISEML